jgi:hypothetical protein
MPIVTYFFRLVEGGDYALFFDDLTRAEKCAVRHDTDCLACKRSRNSFSWAIVCVLKKQRIADMKNIVVAVINTSGSQKTAST